MKIAVWYNLPSGGAKRALHGFVRGLVERGHQVEAWCPPTTDREYLPLRELITEHVLPLETATSGRSPLARGPYAFTRQGLEAMDRHCRACADEINRGGFDLLFAKNCWMYGATSIAQYVKVPRVLYLQEPYRALYEAMPELTWAARPTPERGRLSPSYLKRSLQDLLVTQAARLRVREERKNAGAYDAILVNSYFSRESVLRAYGLDARVSYLGIDHEMFVDHGLPRQDFLVGIGSFDPWKNIEFVIRAVAAVPAPRPQLVWIGNSKNTAYLTELAGLAQSLGVIFEPKLRLSDAEMVGLLNQARMMVYAPRLEPFGFAPLEANACGLPVMAVKEGGIRETVRDGVNGLLVDSDPAAMAAGIGRLRDEADLACRMRESARRLVTDEWTWDKALDRLEEHFSRVFASEKAGRGA